MKVTIEAVAKAAGVSKTAVSFVLNNRQPQVNAISKATRERIWECANTLGYRKNPIAASLRTGNPLWIGVIGEIIADDPIRWRWAPHFELALLLGVQKKLAEKGYFTLLGSRYGSDDVECLDLLASSGMGGLITKCADKQVVERAAELLKRGIPVVNVFPLEKGDLQPYTVDLDNFRGGQIAGEMLMKAGTENPMYVTLAHKPHTTDDRVRGFLDILQKHPVLKPHACELPEGLDDKIRVGMLMDVIQDKRPDAIIAMSAGLSVLVDFAIYRLNMNTPDDIRMIGFDCHSFRNRRQQKMTSVGGSWWQAGRAAADMILTSIRGGVSSISPVLIDPVFVPGETTPPQLALETRSLLGDPFMPSAEAFMAELKS